MSDAEILPKQPCERCGKMFLPAEVSVAGANGAEESCCVECRRRGRSNAEAVSTENPVSLTGDDIVTVTCQLCRSSLLVNESKIGTEVTCPDCHSKVVVQRSQRRSKNRSQSQPNGAKTSSQKRNSKPFDPDAELSLEEPAELPRLDPLFGLDDVAGDLLPLPASETDAVDNESLEPDQERRSDETGQSSKQNTPLTRRQRYERVQKQVISDDRKEKRRQALAKKTAKKNKPKRRRSKKILDDEALDGNPAMQSTKRRRRRRRKGDSESKIPAWVQPAFGWLRVRSMLFAWGLATLCLGFVYFADGGWSPLVWLDRCWVMLAQQPTQVDFEWITHTVLSVVGSVCVYAACGRNFIACTRDDFGGPEIEDAAEASPNESVVFTTFQFAGAWLLSGLMVLFWSILWLPIQFLIIPPLMFGAWQNRSVWKFVRSEGLLASGGLKNSRSRWLRFYSAAALAAILACGPTWMMYSGGAIAIAGCLLLVAGMIAFSGIFGRHCRELKKSLETSL